MSVSCSNGHISCHGIRPDIHMRKILHPSLTTCTFHRSDMYRNSFHNKWAFHCTETLPTLHDNCTPAPRKLTKQQMWKCSEKFFDFNYPRPTTVSIDTSGVGMALESFIEWIFSVLWQAQLMGLLCSNFFHWKDFSHSSFVRAPCHSFGDQNLSFPWNLPLCNHRQSIQLCNGMCPVCGNIRFACCNLRCKWLTAEKRVN